MCNWLTVGCALGAHDKNASVEAHLVEKNKAVEKYPGSKSARWVSHINVPLTTQSFSRFKLDNINKKRKNNR